MFTIIILHLFLALQLPRFLTLRNEESFEDQTHTANEDQINDLMVKQFDYGKRIKVRTFSFIRFVDCMANPLDVANNRARFDLFIRAKAVTVTANQCSLPYAQTNETSGYNTYTNHYPGRQTYYQKTIVWYHAVTENECHSYVRYLLELSTP